MFSNNRYLLSLFILASPLAFAGDLNPTVGPDKFGSAMYNIQDICNRLDTGATGSKQTFTLPPISFM